jgi:hypothetical protein
VQALWSSLFGLRGATSRERADIEAARFLDMIEDAMFALYGGVLARNTTARTNPAPPATRKPSTAPPSDAERRTRHRQAMREAVLDPATTAWDVERELARFGPYRLEPRSRYNYACLLVDLALPPSQTTPPDVVAQKTLDRAVAELRAVFAADIGLRDRGVTDPALIRLRNEFPARWGKLVPPQLAGLLAIGSAWAARLAQLTPPISSLEALIGATGNAQAVDDLAERLGAPAKLVRQWESLSRLSVATGATAAEVNLLSEAGAGDLAALAAANKEDLQPLLKAINDAMNLVPTPPSEDRVARWIVEAKKQPTAEDGHGSSSGALPQPAAESPTE